MARSTHDGFWIDVSPDRMACIIGTDPVRAPDGVDPAAVLTTLLGDGVQVDQAARAELESLASRGERFICPAGRVVARGLPPVEPTPGKLERVASAAEFARSHYERGRFRAVEPGEVVAKLVLGSPGQDGVDIYGLPVPPKTRDACIAGLGPNVRLDADGTSIVAARRGWPVFTADGVDVSDCVEVPGDVDFATGCIDVPGDVKVGGGVLDKFRVRAGGSLTVGGAVEAAQVEAGSDITIGGGILGKGAGACTAGRDIRARFISNAFITAGGDVAVESEINNSTVRCRGLLADHGAIVGGHVEFEHLLRCAVLGSPARTRTVVQVRRLPTAPSAEVDPRLEPLRAEVATLQQSGRTLTPQQRERLTELLFKIEELGGSSLPPPDPDHPPEPEPTLEVLRHLHAGVVFRVGQTEWALDSDIRGPVTLTIKPRGESFAILLRTHDGHERELGPGPRASLSRAAA